MKHYPANRGDLKPSSLTIIKKAFDKLPEPEVAAYGNTIGAYVGSGMSFDLFQSYAVAHKVIAGMIKSSSSATDAAGIAAISQVVVHLLKHKIQHPHSHKINNGSEEISDGVGFVMNNLETIFAAAECAPPAQTRSRTPE